MSSTEVVTMRGATPKKALEHIRRFPSTVKNYKVIILHFGTNCLSDKDEWGLYLKRMNSLISESDYDTKIARMNPPLSIVEPDSFREAYQTLIGEIKTLNPDAKILISSIIPRLWDYERRDLVRRSFNEILRSFSTQQLTYFIPSYKPFFDKKQNLKRELFSWDGLHLSQKGTVVLRSYFCDRIDKALKNLLK